MSDDLVKQALAELGDLVRCRCTDAYKIRGLHDPLCECDSAAAVQVVTARIRELEAEVALLQTAIGTARNWLEVSLFTNAEHARAKEALDTAPRVDLGDQHPPGAD